MKTADDGRLIALLAALLYGAFTLLPGSHGLMVTWPWVALWQGAVMVPMVWLLWLLWRQPSSQLQLGGGLDWIALLAAITLVASAATAEFSPQARWYAWAALGGFAALYAVHAWLTSPQRCRWLLRLQGGVAIAFILLSLSLWIVQIYLPELSRLSVLSQYGIDQAFSFNLPSLRNWQPIGHQNYVAGYLVLGLPLLVGLAGAAQGRERWLWAAGAVLGLVNLYTTSSRGGWLALMVTGVLAAAVALSRSPRSRRGVLAVAVLGLVAGGVAIATNPRLSRLITALLQGNITNSELAYRAITNLVGWRMGAARPWLGAGPGSVPLLYQNYLPVWGGREAELQYQLHSTPAQIWAELGLGGILSALLLLLWLLYGYGRWQRRGAALPAPLIWGMGAGLCACGLISLTDYQLDNLSISGGLVVYLAVLARGFTSPAPSDAPRLRRILVGLGAGGLLAMTLWLIPVHRAWMLSAQGFDAFRAGQVEAFVQRLTQAHQLAPWESYYPYQLGWQLGDLSYRAEDPGQAAALRSEAIDWLQRGLAASPYQEFGYSNLGWLQIQADPAAAVAVFNRSAELLPVKEGVFFGLGFSLLLSDRSDLAVEAMALELLRHPMTATSSLWQLSNFAPIYDDVLARVDTYLSQLLESEPEPQLRSYGQQVQGGLRWWAGDLAGAASAWQPLGHPINQALLDLAAGRPVDSESLGRSPGAYAVRAWLEPELRSQHLTQAWSAAPADFADLSAALPPPPVLAELTQTMAAASSLDDWLKVQAPSAQLRNSRLGFNVISRHGDGLVPVDYYPKVNNIPMVQFFGYLLPSPSFLPELDRQLQPSRQQLLQQIGTQP